MTGDLPSAKQFREQITSLRGKSAAVVYGFAPAGRFTQIWYDQWRSSVISSYGGALEELGLHPYFVDAATFARQALDGSLPEVVCAFNLNAGITPIHHWSMVPSVASWCGIKPFPAEADVLIVGERKDTASLLARECGFAVPKTFHKDQLRSISPDMPVIRKPRDLGGSVGLVRSTAGELAADDSIQLTDIIQEFVRGFDLTIPVVWQPTLGGHRCVAGVMYLPEDNSIDWYHSAETKESGQGYLKRVIPIPAKLERMLVGFAKRIELGPYARIDIRVQCDSDALNEIDWKAADPIFIEVNPLPTLRHGINFLNVVGHEIFQTAFKSEAGELAEVLRHSPSAHAFVLACALATLGTQSQA